MVDSDKREPEGQDKVAPVPRSAARRWLRVLRRALLGVVLLLALAVAGLWWWAGRDDSLAYTLDRVAGWLPEGQSLHAREVTGSLRRGGRIGSLQWQSPTMQVKLRGAEIGWSLRPLLSRSLRLGQVHIAELELQSRPDPDKPPSEPLQQLELPLKIDVPFAVDRIVWQGPPEAVVDGLQGHYNYDGSDHRLVIDSLRWVDGSYQAKLQLQGASPMKLQASAQGVLRAPNPLDKSEAGQGGAASAEDSAAANSAIAVEASVQAQGTLATAAARLEVAAQVKARPDVRVVENTDQNTFPSAADGLKKLSKQKRDEKAGDEPAGSADGQMQAALTATIEPWKPQPLLAAKADLRHLDVAAFWPQGPRTELNGQVEAGPMEPGGAEPHWQLQARLRNTVPGPWDRQRLPVAELHAGVRYDGQRWSVPEAAVDLGEANGKSQGRIELQGFYDTAGALFAGQAAVQQLNPARLHTSLDAAPLQGTLSAEAVPSEVEGQPSAVRFAVDLKAAAQGAGKALRLQTLSAHGQWSQPVLTLAQLQLEALQASVNGKAISYDIERQQAEGLLQLQVPGARLEASGRMGAKDGKGQAALQLASLEMLAQWLRKLPGVDDPLAGAQLAGKAGLQLDWRGGWGALAERLRAAPGDALPASGLRYKLRLQGEQLRYQPKGAGGDEAIAVPQLQLVADGSPENTAISLKAQALRASQAAQLDTNLHVGLASAGGGAPLDWQASVEALQAQMRPGKDKPGPWNLQLVSGAGAQAVSIAQRTSGRAVLETSIAISPGQLRLAPPELGHRAGAEPLPPVELSWSASQLTKAGNGGWAVRSAGRVRSVPIAWVDALSMGEEEPPLEAMGLSGDLSFNGQWDLDTMGKSLKAQLLIERAGGDLRLAVDDGEGTTVTRTSGPRTDQPGQVKTSKISGSGMRARIKDARIVVEAQGEEVTARLLWDSERAGQASAQLRTRLARQDGGWTLPPKAPLSGQLEAKMPDIGIWALFAPPGWRVKGSLQAQAVIAGDMAQPQWQGSLGADGLSVVSVLDGVDLQQGVLRAKLQGNRVDINELRFKGGKGSRTRVLGYSGNLTNAPEDGGELTGSGHAEWIAAASGQEPGLNMRLQARATKLQVLVRADRQVSVSGDLDANLANGQFVLRGDLTVDRATIILPEESAPSLDKDVVVHTAASRKAEAEAAARQRREEEKSNAQAQTRKLPDLLVKLDLGRDFALQGFGLTTRLLGQLEVRGPNRPGGPPRVTGEVRTEQGRYRAWGQSLDIETGMIRFNGPYDNPSLDILAIRPNIATRAGIQVLGTASAPRVRLYSDPDLPDAEKLSWVVMGRDPAAGGASSALLQQAALALLSGGGAGGSGKIASSLGLDEVGFKGGGDGNGASGAALTMGKRLAHNLYLTYEQSLSGAMGTIYIFYDLSRRLTLRGQTGVTSALDLIYTIRKD